MKIIKTASGKSKVKMSKKEWTDMGKKAGWMKKAQETDEDYQAFQSQDGYVQPVYVSTYTVSREYGGPEEGGWWYDDRKMVSSKKFYDREEAEKYANYLRTQSEGSYENTLDQYPDPSGGDPMYDHSDADIPVGFSGSNDVQIIIEDHAGENETQGRPHYE